MTTQPDPLARLRRAVLAAAPAVARDLPWTSRADAWGVLVSEVMLQQTPAARVAGQWVRFMELFPTPSACAAADQSDVLSAWMGLGYPRRARSLHLAAREIRDAHAGIV
ncbi:MAG: A/G-specific adenine glycosylase, partial [Acidimicrobiales bacterium]